MHSPEPPEELDPTSAYCLQAEYDIFCVLEQMMDRDGALAMGGLWQAGVPKMKLRVYQLDKIMKWTIPRLHAHFDIIKLTPEVLVAQWFLTIFSYTVPIPWTLHIWDYVFCYGWPAAFRVVLSLLKMLELDLLQTDLEGVGYHNDGLVLSFYVLTFIG
jgi:hypothetical protein